MATQRDPSAKPRCWNPFQSIKIFVVCHSLLQLAQLMLSACLKSSVSTIERRYGFTSQKVGVLVAFNEVGNVMLIAFVSFLGSRVHRPRFIGAGGLLASVSALIITLPHFLSGPYQYTATANSATNNTTSGLCLSQSSVVAVLSNESCGHGEGGTPPWVFPVLLLGQLLLGISTVPIQPFGMSYVDDFASRRNSPFYIGIIFSMTSLGPAMGFLMGAFTLRLYVDFDKIPTDQIQLDPKDLRWVGAWWLGFLITSCLLFLTSLPYLFFPRSMGKEGVASAKESESDDEKQPVQTVTLSQFLRSSHIWRNRIQNRIQGFPKTALRTLRNPVFLLLCLAHVCFAGVLVGVLTFLAKYMEHQFNMTTSLTTQFMGLVHIPLSVVAIFVGGATMRRLDLSHLGAVKWCTLAMLLTLLCSAPLLFIGCPTHHVADVFPPSSNGSMMPCSSRCRCPGDMFNPVCAFDTTEFRSPCHAGCIAMETDSTNRVQNYTSCGCVGNGGGGGGGGYALPGTCGSRCSHLLVVFMVLSGLICFTASICKAPSFSAILRSVPPEDKTFAVGVCYMMFRGLGFLPTPVLYGRVIDRSCLLWGRKCGKKTSCQYYDLDSFRRGFFGLLFGFLCACVLCYLMAALVLWKQTVSLEKKAGSDGGYRLVSTAEGARRSEQASKDRPNVAEEGGGGAELS